MTDQTYDAKIRALKYGETHKISEFLGKGAFGWVFKYQTYSQIDPLIQSSSAFSAVKYILPNKDPADSCAGTSTSTDQEIEQREFENSVKKRHKNILGVGDYNEQILLLDDIPSYFGTSESDVTALKELVARCIDIACMEGSIKIRRLTMTLCGKDLRQWLAYVQEVREIPYLENQRCGIICGILNGLNYLHGQHVLHRDLKPENIFFSVSSPEEWLLPVKIADFGLSRDLEEESPSKDGVADNLSCVGTASYMAPEVTSGNYTFQADLFSLGLIIWEIFQPIVENERKELFWKLVHCGDTSVVQITTTGVKELIVALTKANVEHRLASIEYVNVTITDDDEIFPNNAAELQICLETQETIILAEVEYSGHFEVNRTGVTIKGQGEKSVIKYKEYQESAVLEISGHDCFLHDFYVSAEERGVFGIYVTGDDNIFSNMTVAGGNYGCFIMSSGNNFYDFNVASTKSGVEVYGDQNIFNRVNIENVAQSGIIIFGSNVFIDNFRFSYGNSETAPSLFSYGLAIKAQSHDCEIRSSNCCAVKIEGHSHTLRDVECGHIIEISNVSGNRHQLKRCKGNICHTDDASIIPIKDNHGNEFSIYSRGLDLQERLENCTSGDVIQLEEGIYSGGFVIAKNNITLKGVGDGTKISCVSHIDTIGLSIMSNDCTISDLQFVTPFEETSGMRVTGTNNVIKNVFFRGGSGVVIDGSENQIRNLQYNKVPKLPGVITCGVLIHSGKSNNVENFTCDATHWSKITFGLLVGKETSLSTLSNCRFGRGTIEGSCHTMTDIEASLSLKLFGQGHTLTKCTSNHLRTDKIQKSMTDCDFTTTELVESEEIGTEKEEETLIASSSESPQSRPHEGIDRIPLNSKELLECLLNCSPGDTIILREGLYEGHFGVMKPSVKIQGAGKFLTILQNPLSTGGKNYVLSVAGNECTISDLCIVATGRTGGLLLHGSGNLARNLAFLGGEKGVEIRGRNNKLSDIKVEDSMWGVYCRGDGNEMENLEMENVSDIGVMISGSCNNALKSARFLNSACGVEVRGNGNTLCDVIYRKGSHGGSSVGVRILAGGGNTLDNLKCEGVQRWKTDLGLELESQSIHARITNSVCERVRIAGHEHNMKNVDFGVRLTLEGIGHSFEDCKALQVVDIKGENVDISGVDIQEEDCHDLLEVHKEIILLRGQTHNRTGTKSGHEFRGVIQLLRK
ncbi:Serine/threonine-protein kinase PDIK1L [Folsomia candida]|uniref:Serine/threonine-protein kinase PDIK1L n=1 Tax=Folsomia candida TaxID=158441 RepID=A0A226E9A3_FOLCA|nr:Serine/threonine-protein kinase PDIK1L [Folsomia candida]